MAAPRKLLAQTLVLVFALLLPSLLFSQAYPVKVENAMTFKSLTVSVNRFSLHAGKGALVLVGCEKGVTGAVVLASGSFSFATEDTQSIHDTFTNALLRFNPADYLDFIAPVGAKPGSQAELIDQTTTVVRRLFLRLYHKGNDALIPGAGVLGGVLTADNLGDLIISEGAERSGVYSLKDRRALFDGGGSEPVPSFQTSQRTGSTESIGNTWMASDRKRELLPRAKTISTYPLPRVERRTPNDSIRLQAISSPGSACTSSNRMTLADVVLTEVNLTRVPSSSW